MAGIADMRDRSCRFRWRSCRRIDLTHDHSLQTGRVSKEMRQRCHFAQRKNRATGSDPDQNCGESGRGRLPPLPGRLDRFDGRLIRPSRRAASPDPAGPCQSSTTPGVPDAATPPPESRWQRALRAASSRRRSWRQRTRERLRADVEDDIVREGAGVDQQRVPKEACPNRPAGGGRRGRRPASRQCRRSRYRQRGRNCRGRGGVSIRRERAATSAIRRSGAGMGALEVGMAEIERATTRGWPIAASSTASREGVGV